MSEFKETNQENDSLRIPVPDIPRIPWEIEDDDFDISNLTDVFGDVFEKIGLCSDPVDIENSNDFENEDYSLYLEKGDDGKYYDKETGKAYDSIEAWVKAQETLAKRYEGTATYYEEKAKKEWARFKNAEQNGESDAEKWEHRRRAKEYYDKAKECREKAEKVRNKLNSIRRSFLEKSEYVNKNDDSLTKPLLYSDIKEKEADDNTENEEKTDNLPIKNKQDGLRRESEVLEELNEKYPAEEGYSIEQEVYLRDKDGNIVRDPVTGEARRIDFVVIKDGKVVDSIEVTSKTSDKTDQSAKESRIREAGGNYIKDSNGNLVEIPDTVQTKIERRD